MLLLVKVEERRYIVEIKPSTGVIDKYWLPLCLCRVQKGIHGPLFGGKAGEFHQHCTVSGDEGYSSNLPAIAC
jgi:hypothetical protein